MSGVVFEVDVDQDLLARLEDEQLMGELFFDIGQLVEDQTKLRIMDEKTDPTGTPWMPWSRGYAKTRKPHHSLLVAQANPGLLDSIQNYTTGTQAFVGTNLVYGAVHQFGSEDGLIPARPYLGLSDTNRSDLTEFIAGRLEDLLQ